MLEIYERLGGDVLFGYWTWNSNDPSLLLPVKSLPAKEANPEENRANKLC